MPNRLSTITMITSTLLQFMMSIANLSEPATRSAGWILSTLAVTNPPTPHGTLSDGRRRIEMQSFWFTILHQESRSRPYLVFSTPRKIHEMPSLCWSVAKSTDKSSDKFNLKKEWYWLKSWVAYSARCLHRRDTVSKRCSGVWHSRFWSDRMSTQIT
jgi:hypothetical protein